MYMICDVWMWRTRGVMAQFTRFRVDAAIRANYGVTNNVAVVYFVHKQHTQHTIRKTIGSKNTQPPRPTEYPKNQVTPKTRKSGCQSSSRSSSSVVAVSADKRRAVTYD